MQTRRAITRVERRTPLGRRHHLAAPAVERADDSPLEAIAGGLVGLHSSDPASVHLAARARATGFQTTDLETALYDDRTLVRLLGMRRTMFVVPLALGSIINAACTKAFAPRERRKLVRMIGDQLVDDPDQAAAWLDDVADRVVEALSRRGQATAGVVRVRLLEDVGSEMAALIDQEASQLTAWLDGTVVTPRFRTPLERDLAS